MHPGDHAVVTITLTGEDAGSLPSAGQRFAIWNAGDTGHGIISRRVCTTGGRADPLCTGSGWAGPRGRE